MILSIDIRFNSGYIYISHGG